MLPPVKNLGQLKDFDHFTAELHQALVQPGNVPRRCCTTLDVLSRRDDTFDEAFHDW
jgi:hypothetical protein